MDFIFFIILQCFVSGFIFVWGKMGECIFLYLVMLLIVELIKFRFCYDECFLNLWVKDFFFILDYIFNLFRYVGKDFFQIIIDDKSGYDYVCFVENSWKFFGF